MLDKKFLSCSNVTLGNLPVYNDYSDMFCGGSCLEFIFAFGIHHHWHSTQPYLKISLWILLIAHITSVSVPSFFG